MIGENFDRLTVVEFKCRNKHGKNVWVCKCECGNFKEIVEQSLKTGASKSCGCYRSDVSRQRMTTHGMSGTKYFNVWRGMIERVTNPNHKYYDNYGGKGISVCSEWLDSFEKFLEDMGEFPDNTKVYTIERLDNLKDYCKENCVWATYETQARNRRKYKNNSTGITGVNLRDCGSNKERYVVYWSDLDGKRKSKSFSCNKYGKDSAKVLAESFRENIILVLNKEGAGYSENHGK